MGLTLSLRGNVFKRILVFAVYTDFKMQMRAGRSSGRADLGYGLPSGDHIVLADEQLARVRVQRDNYTP